LEDPQPFIDIPPRKFQHRYRWHVSLFLITLLTTTWVGWDHALVFSDSIGTLAPGDLPHWSWTWIELLSGLARGLVYSAPILIILGAHEFGHYWYCRRHNVDASLPYFLPAPPLLLTGTFGAVIRIKERFPSTKALFDIGVAGPIAGFVALLPFLYWGVVQSVPVKVPANANLLYFGEPLLYKAMAWWHFGALPEGFDIFLHPMGFAAWFGMLATAMNLLPFGQLDGGHIAYAVFGPRARYLSLATLAVTMLLTWLSLSWISMAVIMLAMALLLGLRHPQIADEGTPLDGRRKLVAVVALIIFVLCFTPVPIETFFGG
jgi:membrane-associated protease RseP (regulator of RpoE activity)